MRFLNLTEDSIFCYYGPELNLHDVTILPPGQSQLAVTSPARYSYLLLQSCSGKSSVAITKPDSLKLKFSLLLGSSWQVVKVRSGSRWKIYVTRSGSEYQFIIFPKRNLASFLAEMPDTTPLYALLLPGTHDTMAFYGWPVYQCQSLETPLHVQLQNGIRVLDIRLAIIEGKLIAYHGKSSQKAPFQTILSAVHAFLTSSVSCRETIVMSIKQEDSNSDLLFSRLVREEFAAGPGGLDILYLKNRIPKLGEVRGKIVLFSRFGWEGASEWENGLEGLGIHPTTWPDSEKDGFTWECKDIHVRTHDWYSIGSFLDIPEKVAFATPFLTPPPNNDVRPTLSIIYTSAVSYLAPPKMVAEGVGWPKSGMGLEGVNSKVGKWLLDVLTGSIVTAESTVETDKEDEKECSWTIDPRLRGWVLIDFYDLPEHSLVDLLVECNFRGRRAGEEGWLFDGPM